MWDVDDENEDHKNAEKIKREFLPCGMPRP